MGGSRNRCFRARTLSAALMLALAAGCTHCRPRVDAALRSSQSLAGAASPAALYTVACPDLLNLQIHGHPEWTGQHEIGPDGCIRLDEMVPLRVEGLTTAQVAARLAAALHLLPTDIQVRAAAYRSRLIFLYGQVEGGERAVPYQGPETVVQVLRRSGGLPAGAEVHAISVVRPHVAAGRRPEVFTIDLEAVLLRGDAKSNVILQPSDQIYVAETRQYSVLKLLPSWLHLWQQSTEQHTQRSLTPDS